MEGDQHLHQELFVLRLQRQRKAIDDAGEGEGEGGQSPPTGAYIHRRLGNLCNVKVHSEPYKGGHVHQSGPLELDTRCKDSAISCNVTHSKGSDWWT